MNSFMTRIAWICLAITFFLYAYLPVPGINELSTLIETSSVTATTALTSSNASVNGELLTTNMSHSASQNEHAPRIAYVTFSHLGSMDRWNTAIFSALEYFIPSDEYYYVVFTKESEEQYKNLTQTNAAFQKYSHRIRPLFVECPEGKFGESPCCKQEKGLVKFHEMYNFNVNTKATKYDWVLFQDDDMYIRSKELQVFAKGLSMTEPIVLLSDNPHGHLLGQAGYLKQTYQCSRDPSFMYPWGQPAVYNKAAFELVLKAFRLGGLVKQCLEYNVTHDVGNAILHWMLSFPALWIRISSTRYGFRGDYIGMHEVGRHGPPSSMANIHQKYKRNKFVYPYNDQKPPHYQWTNTTAFRTTSTYQKYGDPSTWTTNWHTMPVSDCAGPTK